MIAALSTFLGRPALAAIAGSFWVQIATAVALGVALVKGYGALREHRGHQAGQAEVRETLKTGVAHDNELAAKARQRAAQNELEAQRTAFRDIPAVPYFTPREIIVRPDEPAPAPAPAAPAKPRPARPDVGASGVHVRVRGAFERAAGDD